MQWSKAWKRAARAYREEVRQCESCAKADSASTLIDTLQAALVNVRRHGPPGDYSAVADGIDSALSAVEAWRAGDSKTLKGGG